MLRNPYITHSLLAALYSIILFYIVYLLSLCGFTVHHAYYVFVPLLVSIFFYGREAGQLEHDFRSFGDQTLTAFRKGLIIFFWPFTNVLQWLFPTLTTIGISLLMYTFKGVV